MANFNDFEDVRRWLAHSDLERFKISVQEGRFVGKSREVANAYLEYVQEHGYDPGDSEDDDIEEPKWEWRPWRVVVVAAFLIGPPLVVWAVNSWR